MNSWVCDGYRDCADGSDEEACPTAPVGASSTSASVHGRCSRFEFECQQTKKCVPNWKRCDGLKDCQDGTDELNCPTHSTLLCPSGFRCEDGEACIMKMERCDGFLDCPDSSDEKNCTDDTLVYKVQNLQWTADFLGNITLSWAQPKKMPLSSCVYNIYYRMVGESMWKSVETHSSKTNTILKVLKPDCTYQVKVQVQCLSKVYNTNDFIVLRTPEGLPDPPRHLQLQLKKEAEGIVVCQWSPPANAHGLIREYVVEYSRAGSKEWSSVRAPTNYSEVEMLQVNALYVFRPKIHLATSLVYPRLLGSITWQKSSGFLGVAFPKLLMIPPPTIHIDNYDENSISFTLRLDANIQVNGYVVKIFWTFDTHRQEKRSFFIDGGKSAQTGFWDSQNSRISMFINSFLFPFHPRQIYGIFYATSFLELYRNPSNATTALHNMTVIVNRDEQYLFLLYAVAVKDLIRKTDRSYKVKTRNSTVEYTIKKLDPGGRYHIVIQLGNMSKEANLKINTVSLAAPDALKIIPENDHILLFWKSLALKESQFNESRGYSICAEHALQTTLSEFSGTNTTSYLGNTTENVFKVSHLKAGHNYSFMVQARCLYVGQMCGEPATLLFSEMGRDREATASILGKSKDVAAIVVPVLFLLLVMVGVGFVVLYMRHRRLQNSFTAFANSHYSSRLGSAVFSSGDDLGK
ncbi:hypothetical protein Chor_005650 [Crotalus horridus]